MNKEIILKLVKVANSLDNMGLTEEANVVDRIAQKYNANQLQFNPLGGNNFQEDFNEATYKDFILEDYNCHPAIKAEMVA